MAAKKTRKAIPRFETGIPGLDTVLKGGFFQGCIYMVIGRPGAGKTILGNQICFHHIAGRGRVLYVTLLTESHARLVSSLEPMSFFDANQLTHSMSYFSGYQALETEKLEGLLKLLRTAIRDHRATFLVIDGLITASAFGTDLSLRQFLHELQVLTELFGCTTLLLTGMQNLDSNYAERTMVDGLIHLTTVRRGMRTVRELEVLKHRGSDCILGAHFFDISNDGITVYPRIESTIGDRAPAPGERRAPLDTGVASLDDMLDGGLLAGSTTLLFGSPGSGKTLAGLNFLHAGARRKESGLYFGFFETPSQILSKARRISLALRADVERGAVALVWNPPFERVADALAKELLAEVQKRRARRLFIDGMAGFRASIIDPDRFSGFFSALSNELRALGVTTIVTEETRDLLGSGIETPVSDVPAMVDNVIFLRYVELRSQLRRLVSVLKVREGSYDSSLREFSIGKRGIEVSSTFESAEAVLSGTARSRPRTLPEGVGRPREHGLPPKKRAEPGGVGHEDNPRRR